MLKGKHKQPLFDEHGKKLGAIDVGHGDQHPRNFSRFILFIVIAAALGYAANTATGHELIDKTLEWLARPVHVEPPP